MRTKTKAWLEIVVWIGILGVASLAMAAGAGTTREERIARGERSYRVYCAGCHGVGAKGDGPLADLLKDRPSDLTRFSAGNGGDFPRERVTEAIDGRAVIRGHGTQMPVWALSFRDRGRDSDQEQEVEERIRDIVQYLESVQVK